MQTNLSICSSISYDKVKFEYGKKEIEYDEDMYHSELLRI